MQLNRQDIQHHTLAEVESYLDLALALAERRGLNEATTLAVLPTLLTLFSGKTVQIVQSVGGGPVDLAHLGSRQ